MLRAVFSSASVGSSMRARFATTATAAKFRAHGSPAQVVKCVQPPPLAACQSNSSALHALSCQLPASAARPLIYSGIFARFVRIYCICARAGWRRRSSPIRRARRCSSRCWRARSTRRTSTRYARAPLCSRCRMLCTIARVQCSARYFAPRLIPSFSQILAADRGHLCHQADAAGGRRTRGCRRHCRRGPAGQEPQGQ